MRLHFVLAIILSLVALPLLAQSNEVAGWVSWAHVEKTTQPGTADIVFSDGNGFGLSYNRYWTSALSTEFAGQSIRTKGNVRSNGVDVVSLGHLDMTLLTGTAQWHFARASAFDPYLGAGVAYVTSDDLSSADLDTAGVGDVSIDSLFGWTANAGLNFNFSRNFGAALDAKYVSYKPDSRAAGDTEATKLSLNPIVVSAGLRFRF